VSSAKASRQQSAGKREAQASRRRERLRKIFTSRSKELYQELWAYQRTLEEQGVADHVLRHQVKARKAVADAELKQLRIQEWRAYELCNTEFRKQERSCKEQRVALRALEEQTAQEKPMYELDHRKDQVMTVYKVALAKSLRHRTLFQFYPEYRTFPSHFSLLSERKVLSSRCATRGLMGMPAVARVAREMSKRPIMRCILRFLSEHFVPFSCLPRAPHLIFCTLGSKR